MSGPHPASPKLRRAWNLGEGRSVCMEIVICNYFDFVSPLLWLFGDIAGWAECIPPPFSFFENGGGQEGA